MQFLISPRSVFAISLFIALEECLASCPSYCQCSDNSQSRTYTCVVSRDVSLLPCEVRWHNLRLTLEADSSRQTLFTLCGYVQQLILTKRSHIVNLTKSTLGGLHRLESFIGEQGGSIQNLGPAFLESTPKLNSIKLYRNKMKTILRQSFNSCAELTSLDLTSNIIDSIENGAFSACKTLKNIRLGVNQLRIIHRETFTDLPSLQTLYLNSNVITDIEEKSFLSASRLQDLWLNENLLQEIGEKMFANLYSLERLDLSDNRISNIRSNAFLDLVSLKVLKLRGNSFGSLVWSQFYPLQSLASLDDLQLACIVEAGQRPNRYVQEVFSRFPLCNGEPRPPRIQATTPPVTTEQHSSPRIETKSDSLPFQRHSELDEQGNQPTAVVKEIAVVPVYMIIIVTVTSLAFLVTLFILIGYCKTQNNRLRHLKRRNRSTPLPLLLQTDECGYLSTAI